MLLAGTGFQDVCSCRHPQGSSMEWWWDTVPARTSHPSHALAKCADVPGAGVPAHGTGVQQVLALADKMGAR